MFLQSKPITKEWKDFLTVAHFQEHRAQVKLNVFTRMRSSPQVMHKISRKALRSAWGPPACGLLCFRTRSIPVTSRIINTDDLSTKMPNPSSFREKKKKGKSYSHLNSWGKVLHLPCNFFIWKKEKTGILRKISVEIECCFGQINGLNKINFFNSDFFSKQSYAYLSKPLVLSPPVFSKFFYHVTPQIGCFCMSDKYSISHF